MKTQPGAHKCGMSSAIIAAAAETRHAKYGEQFVFVCNTQFETIKYDQIACDTFVVSSKSIRLKGGEKRRIDCRGVSVCLWRSD